ncbi:MAG: hypothetical protein R3318_05155 [Gammaproteobacteria bacterium]|nr:hypothetical protein [Gammaproteobacteria bacterium]
MTEIDAQIRFTADPEAAQRRFDELNEDSDFRNCIDKLNTVQRQGLLGVLGYSDFLSNYLRRFPESVLEIGEAYSVNPRPAASADEMRRHKYRELFKLTARDLVNQEPYESILRDTSLLADEIVRGACSMLSGSRSGSPGICILGMGKLGAMELNYSSDIDLIFVCEELEKDENEVIENLVRTIRKFTRLMEEITGEGFLYRVDLRLRPWGRSGPLILTIDDTENYYSASTEAWERFIWLRARAIAGQVEVGNELLRRLEPFVYRKFLSNDDLDRFLDIKSEMQMHHKKSGNWNVKQGSGGIRDIEFFIQLLQIVNACDHSDLKTTTTLDVLQKLRENGFVEDKETEQIRESYLFLRRLENHLQMIDERQTHQLPEEKERRRLIARSMIPVSDTEDALGLFEEKLALHQAVARNCFERILPASHLVT